VNNIDPETLGKEILARRKGNPGVPFHSLADRAYNQLTLQAALREIRLHNDPPPLTSVTERTGRLDRNGDMT
jgi:hypothetical protein